MIDEDPEFTVTGIVHSMLRLGDRFGKSESGRYLHDYRFDVYGGKSTWNGVGVPTFEYERTGTFESLAEARRAAEEAMAQFPGGAR